MAKWIARNMRDTKEKAVYMMNDGTDSFTLFIADYNLVDKICKKVPKLWKEFSIFE